MIVGNAIVLQSIGVYPPVAEWTVTSGNITSVKCTGFRKLPTALCSYKTKLASIDLSECPNIEEIGDEVFYHCTALQLSSLPATIKKIGYWAFRDCGAITLSSLPPSLEKIGGDAFRNCSNITLSSLPSTVSSLTYGGSSYSLGTFYGCSKITISQIPSGVSALGQSMFYGCTSIPSMDLSTTAVSAIPSQCFYNCKAMTYVDLPSTVTSIAAQAFRNCTALKTVYCRSITPPTLANTNAFQAVDLLHIYVPVGSANAYKTATNWSSFASLIEEYNFT